MCNWPDHNFKKSTGDAYIALARPFLHLILQESVLLRAIFLSVHEKPFHFFNLRSLSTFRMWMVFMICQLEDSFNACFKSI